MAEIVAGILSWVVPALVVFGVAAIAIAVDRLGGPARRAARRVPAPRPSRIRGGRGRDARAASTTPWTSSTSRSGSRARSTAADAPASLRRARLTAQHVRDESFEEYRAISDAGMRCPTRSARVSARIERRAHRGARDDLRGARRALATGCARTCRPPTQVAAARRASRRCAATMGDPAALVAELSSRFAEDEWRDASRAARAAVDSAAEAERSLVDRGARRARATRRAAALAELAAAERSLRRAEAEARTLEETHRLVTAGGAGGARASSPRRAPLCGRRP